MRFDMMAINIVFAMVSAALILVYLKHNNVEFCKNRAVVFIIVFGLLNGILSTKTASLGDLANTIKPLLLMVLSVLIIKFLLNLKLTTSLVSFLLLMVGMSIGNSFAMLIVGIIVEGDVMNEIASNGLVYMLTNSLVAATAIMFLLAIRPLNKLIRQIINNKELAFTLISTFVIISANVGLYYYVKAFNFTSFLAITILSLLYFTNVIFNSTVIYKRHIEKTEREQQSFFNQSLEESLFNLRRFKHDWNNNLATIGAMVQAGKYTDAVSYLNEISEYNSKISTKIYDIKNAGLFGILSAKQRLAQEKGLNIEINGLGEISDIPQIKMSELCEIVGIFLDNAIEESEKANENIQFTYSGGEDLIELSIKNKCLDNVDLAKITKFSSKGTSRGNGLKIVERVVGQYKHIQNFRTYDSSSKTFEQLLIIEKGL